MLVALSLYSFGQKEVVVKNAINETGKKHAFVSDVKASVYPMTKNYDVIGLTNYDLQTNSGSAQRLIVYPDGKKSAVWIQDQATSPGGTTRGTGYAHFDGSSWQFNETTGNERVESGRAGWGTLMTNGTDEMVISHYRAAGGLFYTSQVIGAAGSSWAHNDLTGGPEAMLWPNTASAGDYSYAIAVDDYVTGATTETIDGVHFYRSTDGGSTWSYEGILPDYASTNSGASGDSYSIDARDNYVAIVVFTSFCDLILWKSDDYGETFTKTKIGDMPVDAYDVYGHFYDSDGNGTADTVLSTDGSGDVVIDSEGMAHVVFSIGSHIDSDASGDSDPGSYFPLLNDGVVYWNESYGEATFDEATGFDNDNVEMAYAHLDTIGWSFDMNDNDTIWEFSSFEAGGSPQALGTSLSTYSSIGVDADDNIYVIFSTVIEGDNYAYVDANPQPENFRGVFAIARTAADGVWHEPMLVTDNSGDWTHPNMAKNVDDNINFIVQYDIEPGNYIKDDSGSEPVTDNFVISVEVPTSAVIAAIDDITAKNINISVYPNPATDLVTVNNVKDATITVYNTLGAVVETIESSDNNATINMSNYAIGTYIIKAVSENGIGTVKVVKSK